MSSRRIEAVLQAAIAEGLVPAGTAAPAQDHRPWPVVLLMGLGAWLAAIPLLAVIALMLSNSIARGAGTFVVGVLALGAALFVLRAKNTALFVEQLAVPFLLVGAGLLAFGLYRDLPMTAASLVLAAIAIALVGVVVQPWLRIIFGATAAVLLVIAIAAPHDLRSLSERLWWAWHVDVAVVVAAAYAQETMLRGAARARAAAALESVMAGWLLAALAGLAVWAGMTFLVGASFGGSFQGDSPRALGGRGLDSSTGVEPLVSILLAVAAAAWLAKRWPSTRRASNAGIAIVVAALAGLMPTLGAVLALLAHCATSGRWRLAAAAAVAAAWIVGAFYYELHWPLTTKAAVLVGAGVVLAGLAAWGLRASRAPAPMRKHDASVESSIAAPRLGELRAGIVASVVLVLAVVNVGIWQKEDLIAHGRPVYLRLVPVDPRSLMQGDYMSIDFAMPADLRGRLVDTLAEHAPVVVARRDARGVAEVTRLDDGSALGPDEVRIEATVKGGRWVLVTDAWYFREGEAARFSAAKFGELRVDASGRALLVGLRGADLQPL